MAFLNILLRVSCYIKDWQGPFKTDAGWKLCRFELMKMPGLPTAKKQLSLTQRDENNRILERLIKTVQMTMTSESKLLDSKNYYRYLPILPAEGVKSSTAVLRLYIRRGPY